MKNKLFTIALLVALIPFVSHAASQSPISRDKIIEREMTCVAQHRAQAKGLTWDDVCYTASNRVDIVNAQMDQVEATAAKPLLISRKKHILDFGTQVYYYRYVEDIPIYLQGGMTGYYANYAYRPTDNFLNNDVLNMYGLQGQFAWGKVDYKGSGKDDGQSNMMYDIRGILGKDHTLADSSQVTPYFGFGYRFLRHQSDESFWRDDGGTLFVGWDRKSQYFYIPIGVDVAIPQHNGEPIRLNLEYDYFIKGYQKSLWGGDGNSVVNLQEHGHGLRASTKIVKKMPWADVTLEPFIRFWNIDESKVQQAYIDGSYDNWVEPSNYTTEIGTKLGLQF